VSYILVGIGIVLLIFVFNAIIDAKLKKAKEQDKERH